MITAIAVAAEYWGNTSPEWWHYIFTVLGDFLLYGALLQGKK